MILDFLDQFTAAAGDSMPNATTTSSTNTVDIGVGLQLTANTSGLAIPGVAAGGGARDLGIGDDPALKIYCTVSTAPSAGTNIAVSLQGAPDDGTGQPGTFTTYATGPTVTQANCTVGVQLLAIDMPRPAPGVAYPRYLRLSYTTTGNMSTGVMKAWIVLDRFDQVAGATGVLSGYVPGVTIAN